VPLMPQLLSLICFCIGWLLHGKRGNSIPSSWWWRQSAPLKHRSTSMWQHGATSQTTLNFIFAAMRTWNLHKIHFSFLHPVLYLLVRYCTCECWFCHSAFLTRNEVYVTTGIQVQRWNTKWMNIFRLSASPCLHYMLQTKFLYIHPLVT
jgi:hypothetical protein